MTCLGSHKIPFSQSPILSLGKRAADFKTLTVTPQKFGTDTNPLITVGGTINNGSLWYSTTPFNPNSGFPPTTIDGFGTLTGGSITVYAQALQVQTTRSGTGDFQDGTSFASPQVVSQNR
jgi:hypothetical protein